MEAKWFKHYIGMSTDDKFRKIHMKHDKDFFVFSWMWNVMLEAAAKDGGWFRQGTNKSHDEDSLFIAFELACRSYGIEIINKFLRTMVEEGMIESDQGFYYIKNWEKYQHASLSTARVQEHRENKQLEKDVDMVILTLNEITGKKFRVKTETYRRMIRGRFTDGYSKENMFAVIRHKFNTWHNDPKMKKFITPETLFRPGNFDRYLNEIPAEHTEAMGTGKLLEVENIYGKQSHITQEQFDAAEEGFYNVIDK
jgi:uncharacterized phage protein (TIGR02220 family)